MKDVLMGYSGPNVFLCLSIASPLEQLPKDVQMFRPKDELINLFSSCQFRSVHIRLSGNYPVFTIGRITNSSRYPITFGEILNAEIRYFLKNSKMERQNKVPTLRCCSRTVLREFLEINASSGHPKFQISTEPSPKWTLPEGHLFSVRHYTWSLQNERWENREEISLGLLNIVESCTIEMEHGPVEHEPVTSFKDLKWDLDLRMCTGYKLEGGTMTRVTPKIRGLHSKSLSSLSIEFGSDFPSFSDIDLRNLTTLSLKINPLETQTLNTSNISLEAFRRCPVKYLLVENSTILKRCPFAPNLSYIEGINIKTASEIIRFNSLPFPHLTSLDITTESPEAVSPNAPKLHRVVWKAKADITWGNHLMTGLHYLKELELHASDFIKHWAPGDPSFPQLRTLTLKYMESHLLHGRHHSHEEGIVKDAEWIPIKAPKLEKFTFHYDVSRRSKNGPILCLKSLPSLKVITFANVQSVKLQDCPELTHLQQSLDDEGPLRSLLVSFSNLPPLRFISYKGERGLNHLDDNVSPVFIRRFYGDHEINSVWESVDEGKDNSTKLIKTVDYENVADIIKKYGKSVDGLKEWFQA